MVQLIVQKRGNACEMKIGRSHSHCVSISCPESLYLETCKAMCCAGERRTGGRSFLLDTTRRLIVCGRRTQMINWYYNYVQRAEGEWRRGRRRIEVDVDVFLMPSGMITLLYNPLAMTFLASWLPSASQRKGAAESALVHCWARSPAAPNAGKWAFGSLMCASGVNSNCTVYLPL